jgi:hypothetical protein
MTDRQQASASEAQRVRAAALELAQQRAAAAPVVVAQPHQPERLAPVSSYEWARWVDGGERWHSQAWDPRVCR